MQLPEADPIFLEMVSIAVTRYDSCLNIFVP